MYNSVRRFGKVRYDTLRLPHKVVAQEADGSVKFGQGDVSAYLFDPDIYTDGRISVQGIDGVLFPFEEEEVKAEKKTAPVVKVAAKPRRGMFIYFYFILFIFLCITILFLFLTNCLNLMFFYLFHVLTNFE